MLSFVTWVFSLWMFLRFIHMVNCINPSSLLAKIFLDVVLPHCIYVLFSWWALGLLPLLAVMYNARLGIHGVFAWTCFHVSWMSFRSETARSHGDSVVNDLNKCQNVLQSQQYCLLYSHLCRSNTSNLPLLSVISVETSYYLIAALIVIAWTADDVEHPFMAYWAFVNLLWENSCLV